MYWTRYELKLFDEDENKYLDTVLIDIIASGSGPSMTLVPIDEYIEASRQILMVYINLSMDCIDTTFQLIN